MYILVFIRLNDVTYYFFVSLQIACFRRDYVVRQKLALVFSVKPNMFRINPASFIDVVEADKSPIAFGQFEHETNRRVFQ